MDDHKTCGKGLATHAPLLHQVSQLAHATASVLNAHLPMLDFSDAASEKEHRLYVHLVDLHRRAGLLLSDAARAMIEAKDLPMGRHVPPDVEEMTKMRESYARFVRVESELRDLLTGRLEPDQRMLDSMGK
ncbi:MAG: hypothetical protein ABIR92_05420 [Gemmatimonadaceae bacterium]